MDRLFTLVGCVALSGACGACSSDASPADAQRTRTARLGNTWGLGGGHLAQHGPRLVHRRRLRHRLDRHGPGAANRHVCRRLRLDLEVHRLRAQLEQDRQRAQPAVARARARAGGGRHDSGNALDGKRERRRARLQVDRRRASPSRSPARSPNSRTRPASTRSSSIRTIATHLLSGLHEAGQGPRKQRRRRDLALRFRQRLAERGKVVVPVLRRDGDAATSSKTWFAIGQDGGSAVMTNDAGKTWTKPKRPRGPDSTRTAAPASIRMATRCSSAGMAAESWRRRVSQHRSGRQLDARGRRQWRRRLGLEQEPVRHVGLGVRRLRPRRRRSAVSNRSATGRHVDQGHTCPAELDWGPNSVAATSDGTHAIFVGSMWATGSVALRRTMTAVRSCNVCRWSARNWPKARS